MTFSLSRLAVSSTSFFRLLLAIGWYRFERSARCPVCGSTALASHSVQSASPSVIRLERCEMCELVFQNPRLNDISLSRYYAALGYGNADENRELSQALFERGIRRGGYIEAFLNQQRCNFDAGSSILEIGCGHGGILQHFRNNGAIVQGCDLRAKATAFGKEKGLRLVTGGVESLNARPKSFDLIILSHVLEHIANPTDFLHSVERLLKPDGYLYIEVPGIENPKIVSRRFAAQLGHLIYFDQRSLLGLVKDCGFTVIYSNDIVQSVFKIS